MERMFFPGISCTSTKTILLEDEFFRPRKIVSYLPLSKLWLVITGKFQISLSSVNTLALWDLQSTWPPLTRSQRTKQLLSEFFRLRNSLFLNSFLKEKFKLGDVNYKQGKWYGRNENGKNKRSHQKSLRNWNKWSKTQETK